MSTITTFDNHQFTLPDDYHPNSDYFKTLQSYKDNPLLTSTSPPVQFTLEEMELLNLHIEELDYNQVITVHSIDRFFQNKDRLDQVELRLTSLWLLELYVNAEKETYQLVKELVNSIVHSNIRCAVKSYLRGYRPYNQDLSLLDNRLYWVGVRQQVLEYVEVEDVCLINDGLHQYQFDRYIRLAERLNCNVKIDNNRLFNLANSYIALIRSGKYESGNLELMALIRYDDLNNRHLNRLYKDYILTYWRNDTRRSIIKNVTYDRYMSNLSNSITYEIGDRLTIFSNNDERVIKEIIGLIINYRIIPDGSIPVDTMSVAAIKLLDINAKVVSAITRRTDVIKEFNCECNIHGLNWYDGDNYRIEQLLRDMSDEIDEILTMPDKIKCIPCVLVLQQDEELANILAELGGRVSYLDLTTLTINSLEFILAYIGKPNEDDTIHILNIADNSSIDDKMVRLLNRIGVEYSTPHSEIAKTISLIGLIDEVDKIILVNTLRPSTFDNDTWNCTIDIIDDCITDISNLDRLRVDYSRLRHRYNSRILRDYYGNVRQYILGLEVVNKKLTNMINGIIIQLQDEDDGNWIHNSSTYDIETYS